MRSNEPSSRLPACTPFGLPLRGRCTELAAVTQSLINGQSVLLVGPEDIGKTAIASAVRVPGVIRRDPFGHVTSREANQLRLSLDRGTVVLATARVRSAATIGAVRRVLWRFRIVSVRSLPAAVIRLILNDVLRDGEVLNHLPARWWTEAVKAADGRPGYAVAIARAARSEWTTRRRTAPPGLAVIDHRISGAVGNSGMR